MFKTYKLEKYKIHIKYDITQVCLCLNKKSP